MRTGGFAVGCLLWFATFQPAGGPGSVPGGGPAVLVSLSAEHRVVLISPDTGAILATFGTLDGPHEIRVSADGRRAYVASVGGGPGQKPSGGVTILNLVLRTTLATHRLRDHEVPHDVRVSGDGSAVWVACAPARAILELEASTGAIRRVWDTDADGGWFVEMTPDTRKIYVPHLEGKSVTAIDRTTGRRTRVYDGGAQSGIAAAPDGREVWVLDHERRRINVIATSTDQVTGSIAIASDAFGRLQFTPDGRRAVLVQGQRLDIIDASTKQVVSGLTMPLAGKVVAIAPDGRRAAVSHPADDKITILNLEAVTVVGTFSAGRTPDGVAWVR